VNVSSIERVQTERLICERVRPGHADELRALVLNPEVAATTWAGPNPPTAADVLEKVTSDDEHWERHGFGPWLLRDRSGGQMVGRGGLKHTLSTGADEVEVGWAIVPERWGRGLATELALAAVEVAFGKLGLDDVIAFTLPTNLASRRVMEKAGFHYECQIEHARLPHVLYRRSRCAPRGVKA
jgi:[ribosomal protein S5]-alanine N-acetyltransferase